MQRRTLGISTTLALVAAVLAGTLTGVATGVHPAAAEGYPTIDGEFSGTGVIRGGETVDLEVLGRGGVPATGVAAVALNVTVVAPTAPTFLTVYPAGVGRPTAASLNAAPGTVVPNMVVSAVGAGGAVTIFNYAGDAHVVVDVLGWFGAGSAYTALAPRRALDTRAGYPTADGQWSGVQAIGPGATLTLPVAGRLGVPATADAVVLNVAATGPTASSFLTVFPAGVNRPLSANLNVVRGDTVSNMVVVELGVGGAASIYNFAGHLDVVVDVLGWFEGERTFAGVTPARLLDSRPGQPTVDGRAQGSSPLGPDRATTLDVTGRAGVPGGAGAVAVNITVTQPTGASFVTAWPSGAARPTAASVNMVGGQTVPNMALLDVGDGGQISLYNYAASTHLVIDVMGWFPAGGGYTGLVPARLMDTRLVPVAPPAPPPGFPASTIVPPALDPLVPGLDPFDCRTYTHRVSGTVADPRLSEISGLARSRRDPSVLWANEDSGARADVIALSFGGQTRQTFRLDGVTARDWEDMDVGPGPAPGVSYLYLGDIGDNGRSRLNITIHRVAEPAVPGAAGVTPLGGVTSIVARYPDGAHNAEAMAVGADGTIYVLAKEAGTPVYAIPYPQPTGSVVTMQKVPQGQLASRTDMSGADIRPDGRALIVRGYRSAWTWPIVLGEPMSVTLARAPCTTPTFEDEIGGEAIAFLGNDGSYVTAGEMSGTPLRTFTL